MPTIRLLELTNFATLSPTKQFLGGLLRMRRSCAVGKLWVAAKGFVPVGPRLFVMA